MSTSEQEYAVRVSKKCVKNPLLATPSSEESRTALERLSYRGTIALLTDVSALASPYGPSRVAVFVLAVAALGGMLVVLRPLPDIREMSLNSS